MRDVLTLPPLAVDTPTDARDPGVMTFRGIACAFDVVDHQRNCIHAGAFDADLQANGSRRTLLWAHHDDDPIGATDLQVDGDKVYATCRLTLAVRRAQEVLALLRTSGALGGLSIGAHVPKGGWYLEDGICHITRAAIVEISLVALPGNPACTILSLDEDVLAGWVNHNINHQSGEEK